MAGRSLAFVAASLGVPRDFSDVPRVVYLRKQAALTTLLAYVVLFALMAAYFLLLRQTYWDAYSLLKDFRPGPMLASLPWAAAASLLLSAGYLVMFVLSARPMSIKSPSVFGLLMRFKRFRFAVDYQQLLMAIAYVEQFGRKALGAVSVATTAADFAAKNPQFSVVAAKHFFALVDDGQEILCGQEKCDFWKEILFPTMFARSKTAEDVLQDFGRGLWKSFRIDRLMPIVFIPSWVVFCWLYAELVAGEFRVIMGA